MNRTLSIMALLVTAIIWGSGFIAQSIGAQYVGAFTFLSMRSILAALVLIPLVIWRYQSLNKQNKNIDFKQAVMAGVICGFFLFSASAFQQVAIAYTTAAKCGFITSTYVIFVPLLSLFFHKKVSTPTWICVFVSVVGLYLLSIHGKVSINYGDLLALICAFLYAAQILAVEIKGEDVDPIMLSFVQFLTVAILAGVLIPFTEGFSFEAIFLGGKAILYAGLMSSGVGYTLQIVGQKGVEPTLASMIMALESVFAAIFGFLILQQVLSPIELIGCLMVFGAVIGSQLLSSDAI